MLNSKGLGISETIRRGGCQIKSLSVKSGVLLVGLLIIGNAEVWGADWKVLGKTEVITLYYDVESITRAAKNIVRVWTKNIFSEEYTKTFGKQYEELDHNLTLIEYNCAERKYNILSVHTYSKDGKIIDSSDHDKPNWKFVRPESLEENLYKAVCK